MPEKNVTNNIYPSFNFVSSYNIRKVYLEKRMNSSSILLWFRPQKQHNLNWYICFSVSISKVKKADYIERETFILLFFILSNDNMMTMCHILPDRCYPFIVDEPIEDFKVK